MKVRTKRRVSPKQRTLNSLSWESSDQESFEATSADHNIVVSHLTGNIIPDSVVVDIGESDEQSEIDEDLEGEQTDEGEIEDEVHELFEVDSTNWEVKMYAAELEKRQSKSTIDVSEVDESDGLLRRRRKRSFTTDTDHSDTDFDASVRPRAGSLDQVNLKKREKQQRGIFKAMSFDRDKDKL